MNVKRIMNYMSIGFLVVVSNSGCARTAHANVHINTARWDGDTNLDVGRISQIVVNETTREQVEAMFGIPTIGTSRDYYHYYVTRLPTKFLFLTIRPRVHRRLLTVGFAGDGIHVNSVVGPEKGAVELLEEIGK